MKQNLNSLCNILGVNFNNVTREQALKILISFLDENKPHSVFTPNPEIVMAARKDSYFMSIINSASLVVPDGIGIVIASRFGKIKLKERVAGYDLVQSLFGYIKDKNFKVYFFGGGPNIAECAKTKMEQKYPGIKIIGVSDGYFDKNKERLIIDDIIDKKPDIVLVGLGAPKQEKWIAENMNNIPAKIFIGVGGSFDGMSGKVKRAPDIFIKFGLEWFYRLMKQPSRFFRMMKLPLFMLIVFKEKIFGKR